MSGWIYTTGSKNVSSNINQSGLISNGSSSPSSIISSIKLVNCFSNSICYLWVFNCCKTSSSRYSSRNYELSNRTLSFCSTVTCVTLILCASYTCTSRSWYVISSSLVLYAESRTSPRGKWYSGSGSLSFALISSWPLVYFWYSNITSGAWGSSSSPWYCLNSRSILIFIIIGHCWSQATT
jgi:hypothetical protein